MVYDVNKIIVTDKEFFILLLKKNIKLNFYLYIFSRYIYVGYSVRKIFKQINR